jgi:GDP-L-fucose synthase
MTVTALRPTLIFGEYDNFDDDTAHFLPAMIRRVVKRERPIEVWGDGSQTRDLVYAGDVVDAALRALRRESGFDAVNIAAGHSYSVIETLEKIIAIDGFADADIIFRRDRPSSIFHRSFSGTRALANYGFSPRTSLEEGLKRTITWYRAQSVGCETPSHSALLQR